MKSASMIFNQPQVQVHVRREGRDPRVIRTMIGAGFRAAAQHSQMLTSIFTTCRG